MDVVDVEDDTQAYTTKYSNYDQLQNFKFSTLCLGILHLEFLMMKLLWTYQISWTVRAIIWKAVLHFSGSY